MSTIQEYVKIFLIRPAALILAGQAIFHHRTGLDWTGLRACVVVPSASKEVRGLSAMWRRLVGGGGTRVRRRATGRKPSYY